MDRGNAPVRIVWKADSTFEASSAEVSMNDSPFSAEVRSVSQITCYAAVMEREKRT
jgi:hypothetical protein